jgi:hypothetical protein
MATVTIYLRNDLVRALSYAELDANFKNIKDTIENLGIDDLTDVVILSPQNGDILVYDTTIDQWVNTQNLQGSYVLNQLAVTGMTQNNSPSYFVSYDETTGDCNKAMDKIIELYKESEHGTELVKDIEKVLNLQTKEDEYTPSPRAKEYLKQSLNLVKGL